MNFKSNIIIAGNVSDSYFAIDIADFLEQPYSLNDIVSLKLFANTEFCPRFTLFHERDFSSIGTSLKEKSVIIISVHNEWLSRNELAMRNMILARAAKDNSAREVVLVEPDLFYSAQDRGPKEDLGYTIKPRPKQDLHKFNGQPFTAKLYAGLLKTSGVDSVITIHNHSVSCQHEYEIIFGKGNFVNLFPDTLYHSYICNSGIVDPDNCILVSPDDGASDFVKQVAEVSEPYFPFLWFGKKRKEERSIQLDIMKKSPVKLHDIRNKDIVVLDDMVRTGNTIVECCKILKRFKPNKIIFVVTHFHPSEEIRENLNNEFISEIITSSTIPSILNRDEQGRLRKKMAVLKIGRWIAEYLNQRYNLGLELERPLYDEDMSDKNPRHILRKSPLLAK